jgi:outer membrane protein assembly factor BamB
MSTSMRVLLPLLVLGAQAASADGGCNWPMYGHDAGHSFAQSPACAQIHSGNAATLTERWFFATGESPITASTTVVNGVAYVGDWSGVMHALDVRTGAQLWSYQIDDQQGVAFGRIVSTAAVDTIRVGASSIRVLLFGGGATLYALDPVNGSLLAKQDVDPRAVPADDAQAEIESSPVVAHGSDGSDRIFVGMDVHNDANIGRTGLLSFELAPNPDGPTPYRLQLVYKFDPETRTLRTSLTDGSGTGRGCGGIWSSPVFDASALDGDGLVVFGTANCGNPDPTHTEAESEGIYALRATTGELRFEFHPRAYNDDDDDFGASPNLLPGGLVGNGGKDGRYYAFSRLATGSNPAAAWTSHPAQSGHLNPQFSFGGVIGTPAVGAVNGEAAIFIASALSTPLGDPNTMTPDPTLAEDPQRMLSLHAISAVDGRILWRSAVARPSFGAPTYANGVVFVPSTVGFALEAYDANTGTLIALQLLTGAPSSSPTIVGDAIFIGTGTSIDPLPGQSQQHGLHAFSIPAAPIAAGQGILLAPQNNQLDAYDLAAALPTTTRTTPIHAHDHEAGTGHDTNGQNCRITQADGSVRYVAGHDNDQDLDPGVDGHPSGLYQGWALHAPTGGVAGEWTMTDKLVPTYNFSDPPNDHLPDNTGCAVSERGPGTADDLLFLVDIGVGAFDVAGVGSLFVYYRDAQGNFSHDSPFCVLDNNLTTGGYLAVDTDGSVLVPESGRSSGGVVSRFSPPFPSPANCPDPTSAAPWNKSTFIQDLTSFTPISIARRATPSGDKWLVGNVVPPMINEYNLDGTFSRPIATEQPTPGVAGVVVDAPGNVYWANLGLAPCDTVLCPVDGLGTLWKASFDPVTDAPLPPVLLQSQLTYPEGMGIADPLPEPSTVAGLAAASLLLAGLARRRAN